MTKHPNAIRSTLSGFPPRPASQVDLEITAYSIPTVEENDIGLARYAGILVSQAA